MEKQEIIKKAYGKSYDALKDYINENGFVDCVKNRKISLIPFFDVLEIEFNGHLSRPKSLKGIENNNGWVKIYCENDMPQFDCDCFIIDKIKGVVTGQWKQAPNEILDKQARFFWVKKATHYKIIDKPQLPLY